jgi:hypothetical protein
MLWQFLNVNIKDDPLENRKSNRNKEEGDLIRNVFKQILFI